MFGEEGDEGFGVVKALPGAVVLREVRPRHNIHVCVVGVFDVLEKAQISLRARWLASFGVVFAVAA